MVADFNPGSLEKRIQQIGPESDELGYKVMKTYMSHLESREKDGKPDFSHNVKQMKQLATKIMDDINEHVLKNYLMAKGAEYDPKQFNKEGVDILVNQITGMSKEGILDDFARTGGEIKMDSLLGVNKKLSEGFEEYHVKTVTDSINANLESAHDYVTKKFGKHGIKVKKPGLLTPKIRDHFIGLALGGVSSDPKRYASAHGNHLAYKKPKK